LGIGKLGFRDGKLSFDFVTALALSVEGIQELGVGCGGVAVFTGRGTVAGESGSGGACGCGGKGRERGDIGSWE